MANNTTFEIIAVKVLIAPTMFTLQVHFSTDLTPAHSMEIHVNRAPTVEAITEALSMLDTTKDTHIWTVPVEDFQPESVEPELEQEDVVNNPKHYKLPGLGVEWIDVRSALLETVPKNVPYEVITSWSECITYLARMWGKNGIQDAEKAHFYLERMLKLSKSRS